MLASPRNMQDYTGNQFGERTVTDLGSIVDDPTTLLFSTSPAARQQTLSASGTGHLDILSASQYPHPLLDQYRQSSLKRKTGPVTGPADQLYGGIVLNNAPGSSSNGSDEPENTPAPPRPRKKAKKATIQDGSDQDDSNKRTRGRPRVDTQDETAADRRRTQIRLAQRAYRHRKETTITSLKGKVTALQSTIEQMNSAFLTLHDNIIDSGLVNGHRALSSHLEKVMSQFEQLAADAAVEEDDDAPAPPPPPPPKATRQKNSAAQRKAGPVPTSNASPLQSSPDSDIEELPLVTFPGENESVDAFDGGSWNDSTSDIMQFHVQIPETQFPLETNTQKDVLDFMAQSPISRPLFSSAPSSNGFYTYSFQETTFARRLHRLCIERAFRSLTNPSTDPTRIARTFRFTFCFNNRRRMLARFQLMLKRKAGESLENYNIPFFRIGGAGTHFPRHDKEGRLVSPPNMLGPERAVRTHVLGADPSNDLWGMQIETPRGEQSVQELLEQLGFGGLWLDSHDVEQYLKTKGIFLDGTSSFVEVDPRALSLDTDLPTSIHSPSSIDSTPLRTPSPFGPTHGDVSLAFPGRSPYVQQPLDDLYPNFSETAGNPDVAVHDYMSSMEKDLRAQPPTQQIAAVQSSQIWPWVEAAPAFDIDAHDDTMFNLTNNAPNNASASASYAGGYAKAPLNYGNKQEQSVAQDGVAGARRVVEQLRSTGVPSVTVDVERLLERLVDGGACLGRAPGFRKELVDNAVVMSLAEAF